MRAAYGVGGPRPDYIDTSACVGCKGCEAQAMKFVSSRICTYSRRSSRRGSRPGISARDTAGQGPAVGAPRLRREPRSAAGRPRTRESLRILSGCREQPDGGRMGDSRRSTAVAVALLFIAVSLSADITVTSITPAAGLTRGGEIVHVHGTNLLGPALACPSIICATYVKFGDAFGEIVDNTAGEIIVIAPPHAAGRVDVEVNVPTNAPVTLASAYLYSDPPTPASPAH